MKIVVLDGFNLNPGDISWEAIAKQGDFIVHDRTPDDEIVKRLGDAEIVFTNKTPLTADTFAACPSIRYIGVLATGYNVVDVKAAARRGITVTNVPTYGTNAVAQMVFALVLEICHHVAHHSRSVHDGVWSAKPDFCYWDYPLIELDGKTMGLIGFGRIGQRTAEIARGFGMNVLYNDIKDHRIDGAQSVPLDALLTRSDVVSLHCPLTADNEGLISAGTLHKMKRSAILINTARGPLVNEKDLADALANGVIAAAALDVVSTEPIRADNPLLAAPNCFLTPHIAWAPKEARQRLMQIAADNLDHFLKGKPCNRVN